MKNLVSQFRNSFKELKKVKNLTTISMFLAVSVILGCFSIMIADIIRLNFQFLPNELIYCIFGPVVGAIFGGLSDLLTYIVHPMGPYFFGFTLNAIVSGLIFGIMLYKKPVSIKRVFIAKAIVMVVVNWGLSTLWLTVLYNKGFLAILPARMVKAVVMLPLETFLLFTVMKATQGVFKAFELRHSN